MQDLPDSALYTFLDDRRGYVAHFLEGQRLVRDLALVHALPAHSFAWLRACVLTALPLVAFLKRDEGLGFYLDSESPYYRMKLEAGWSGALRALLLAGDFRGPVERVTGECRVVKQGPSGPPYVSVIDLDDVPLAGVVDETLARSFQADAAVLLSDESDQSVLLHRLPDAAEADSAAVVRDRLAEPLEALMARALSGGQAVADAFADLGFRYLHERHARLECACSRERMLDGLKSVARSGDDPFVEGADSLEARCDYCGTVYAFTRDEVGGTG